MENKAISDTGPIIHLSEINIAEIFEVFSLVLIPEEVAKELNKNNVAVPKKINIKKVKPEYKDKIKILINQNSLGLGESAAIALGLQEKANYFLTDDLDARMASRNYGLEAHGSVGIILRAFRKKMLNKNKAIEKVIELQTKSSLFITSDLIRQTIKAIDNYKNA